ncbi:MAG TPA: cobyrinate a,c-diamide synthase [Clostridiales bacterium]|nr:cobyrinate a,c-diamide synthase [Clostridiales bacterium]
MDLIPRFILAGTHSGCGKTTVSAGVMAALVKRGLQVQPYKVGPDYIDPMFHTYITGRASRNLDSWLLDAETLAYLFHRAARGMDLAVVEGVMGLYDGCSVSSMEGSTAHVARLLNCPVILVIQARGMSLSAAALVNGYMDFMGGSDIRGVILNGISSPGLFLHLKKIIEENTGVRVVGYLPESEDYTLAERHLGLVPDSGVPDLKEKVAKLAARVEECIDLDLLLRMAKDAGQFRAPTSERFQALKAQGSRIAPATAHTAPAAAQTAPAAAPTQTGAASAQTGAASARIGAASARIAVAKDEAFNFYYQDNLDLLQMLGAELLEFSPLRDRALPEEATGVYLGGGYPEVFARELSENTPMLADLKGKLNRGLPAYGECGGFMYLCRSIRDHGGNTFSMAGLFPYSCVMTEKLQRFGYVHLNFMKSCILGQPGSSVRGHEFHYSTVDAAPEEGRMEVVKYRQTGDGPRWRDGYRQVETWAGYPHIHFWSNPETARNFVKNCTKETCI